MTTAVPALAEQPQINAISNYLEGWVNWYFVSCPIKRGNQIIKGIPISPNYRTKGEALEFLENCGIDNAYAYSHGIAIEEDNRVIEESRIFDGKNPADCICYTVEDAQSLLRDFAER